MIAKEARALVPVWAAVAAAMLACSSVRDLYPFCIPSYFIGAAALGAMSMGHEYSHRTLPLMLTLPVSRQRVLLTKQVVLGAFLFALAIFAAFVLPAWRDADAFRQTVLWLPFFASLFVTPYLTVVSRSPVGGAVFTLAIAGMTMMAGEWIGISKYGYTRDVDAFRVAFVSYAFALMSAASAAGLWWTFGRMEALDGGGKAVDLAPATITTSRTLVRQNPTWLLIKKELRLQQLAFAVAALYAVTFAIAATLSHDVIRLFSFGSIMYAGLLTLLIGATASAEERHLRTLDAQLLLPVSAARQWAIKIAVVLALTLVLPVLLPGALEAVFRTPRGPSSVFEMIFFPRVIVILLAVVTVSLYISTLCSSGLWALMLSVPSAVAVATFVSTLGYELQGFLHSLDGRPDWRLVERTSAIMIAAVILVVFGLAFANHRSADRSLQRTARQVAIAAGSAVAATLVVALVGSLSR